jgi:hypothetical protein
LTGQRHSPHPVSRVGVASAGSSDGSLAQRSRIEIKPAARATLARVIGCRRARHVSFPNFSSEAGRSGGAD